MLVIRVTGHWVSGLCRLILTVRPCASSQSSTGRRAEQRWWIVCLWEPPSPRRPQMMLQAVVDRSHPPLAKRLPVSNDKVSSWSLGGGVQADVSWVPLSHADLWPLAPYVLSLWEREETKEPEGAWGRWLLFWFLQRVPQFSCNWTWPWKRLFDEWFHKATRRESWMVFQQHHDHSI